MKGFALNDEGDVIVEKGKIPMASDEEHTRQTVKTVLETNKGEWFLNTDEGINFSNLLGKKKDDEVIRNEILQGLQQVDSSFVLESFDYDYDKNKRVLSVNFRARNSSGEEITAEELYD